MGTTENRLPQNINCSKVEVPFLSEWVSQTIPKNNKVLEFVLKFRKHNTK